MQSNSQIQEFFKDQTVFITGGSGFLGKVLIEKLLRDCNEIRRIYVLMRSKKNKTPEQRFTELFSYACFDVLKSKDIRLLEKVSLISGDCQQPFLGLKEKDIAILLQDATCVIHAAANVKFDQSLREAAYNVRATRDVLELAKKMKNLKIFVFVSTAFSNCVNLHIKEQFYEPPLKAEKLIQLVDAVDDDTLRAITPRLLGKWPNTYVFTKSISEDLLKRVGNDLPISIVRPGIVVSSVAEPIIGWIDNFYGVIGIVVGVALGIIRTMHVKPSYVASLVPVDYVSNCVLASTWKRNRSDATTIYNFVGHKNNQITWGKYMKTIEPHCWKAATEKCVWYFCFKPRENKIWNKICVFFLHTVAGYIADFVLLCLGRPTLAVKNYQRLNKMLDLLEYFSTRNWNFDDDNVTELWNDTDDKDKKLFCFNMEDLDYDSYTSKTVMGARIYLLKETPDTIPKGKRKLKILFVAHYTVVAVLSYLLYKLIMFFVELIF